ncbi:hypothetical protein ROO84_18800 [Acinetobacter baumannii]|uniref:hypothetical protein n=1 Tax=Acinetobacter baumannii TaxID=470 RepID=UPI002AAE957F|nr:hypothetical protein [Acinetobacter baumannii]MDY7264132.1 hypothetical protein [Acinetobacter baumannii]MDY7291979.1 hypothetical protein [Acinetobacter baumannii]
MGQAKQRGTLEQRVKQAQEQKDDFYGTERSVAEVLAELGFEPYRVCRRHFYLS